MFKIIYGWQYGWQSKTQKIFWYCSCTWKCRWCCFVGVTKFLVFPQKRFTEWACVQETSTVCCAVSAHRAIQTGSTTTITLELSRAAIRAGSTTTATLELSGAAIRTGTTTTAALELPGAAIRTGTTTTTTLVLAGSAIGTSIRCCSV